MSSFNNFLGQPKVITFSEGNLVVSREHYSLEEALKIFQNDFEPALEENDLKEQWVQYCRGSDFEFEDGMAWWLKETGGRNRKKVWVVN